METKVMNITPEMAKEFLTHNIGNRPMRRENVREYAHAMLDGSWRLTHQGIAFDSNGVLIDGQNRLTAIVESGMTVPMNVTTGIERNEGELLEIDTGRKRTYGNIMKMAGIEDRVYVTMNGVVSQFLRWKMKVLHVSFPAHVIQEYVERHYDEVSYIAYHYGFTGASSKNVGYKHAPAIVAAAALSALYGHENRDAIAKFGQVWSKNDTACTNAYNVKLALDCRRQAARDAEQCGDVQLHRKLHPRICEQPWQGQAHRLLQAR